MSVVVVVSILALCTIIHLTKLLVDDGFVYTALVVAAETATGNPKLTQFNAIYKQSNLFLKLAE